MVYAQDVLKGKPGNLRTISEFREGESLLLDPATQRNLEIFKTSSQTRKGSLLDSMDQTVTAAGSRLLERFLSHPERDIRKSNAGKLASLIFLPFPKLFPSYARSCEKGNDLERILGRLRNRLVSQGNWVVCGQQSVDYLKCDHYC